MDSLITMIYGAASSVVTSVQSWLLSMDMGVMVGIIVLTSVLKSILLNYKIKWLNDSVVTGFLFVTGMIAGVIMRLTGNTDKSMFLSAIHYSGGATLLFMMWKHIGLKALEKIMPNSGVVKVARNILTSTTTTPSNPPEDKLP